MQKQSSQHPTSGSSSHAEKLEGGMNGASKTWVVLSPLLGSWCHRSDGRSRELVLYMQIPTPHPHTPPKYPTATNQLANKLAGVYHSETLQAPPQLGTDPLCFCTALVPLPGLRIQVQRRVHCSETLGGVKEINPGCAGKLCFIPFPESWCSPHKAGQPM